MGNAFAIKCTIMDCRRNNVCLGMVCGLDAECIGAPVTSFKTEKYRMSKFGISGCVPVLYNEISVHS